MNFPPRGSEEGLTFPTVTVAVSPVPFMIDASVNETPFMHFLNFTEYTDFVTRVLSKVGASLAS